MDNHKSDEIEIDLNFSDDISEELSVDLSDSLPNKIEEIEDIVLDSKPLPFEDISKDIVVEEVSSDVEPRLVLELEDNSKTVVAKAAKEADDEVIELVNVVKEDSSSSNITEPPIAPILDKAELVVTEQSSDKEHSLENKISEDNISMSEESIVAMFEKIVEKRYGGQLDAMVLQVVENIVNRQIDDIKKKILTALQ
ncbi:MAG: hypothetical protein HQK64_05750 [Desulfamplus sp.]|nr:hypothetical protein [Desulfamplus sp.]MBF0390951.1 hypothetical protein [Desulfamplus sp.]